MECGKEGGEKRFAERVEKAMAFCRRIERKLEPIEKCRKGYRNDRNAGLFLILSFSTESALIRLTTQTFPPPYEHSGFPLYYHC